MKRIVFGIFFLAALCGCTANRYSYVDIASSHLFMQELKAGFLASENLPGGRRAYLLSQGTPVADIFVYGGERTDTIPVHRVPYGFNYTKITTDELLHHLHTIDDRLYTDDGRNGLFLYLQDTAVSDSVFSAICNLAYGGAIIGGERPRTTLSPVDTAAFLRQVDKVWQSGNVVAGMTLSTVIYASGRIHDMKTRRDSLVFEHRHLPNGEIYHVRNLSATSGGETALKFRVTGRRPMIWNPDTGDMRYPQYKIKALKTKVVTYIAPDDDFFVVFVPFADKYRMKAQ